MHFVVALLAEARPLIERFSLRGCAEHHAFSVFSNADGDIRLILSGIGKVRAAAATAYLHAVSGVSSRSAWLNVGIAGHTSLPLGSMVRIHRITDAASGRSWYPSRAIKAPCAGAELVCVDRIENSYHSEAVYDMESAGFYPIAARFTSAELVQCCKVVSDNLESPVDALRHDDVESLIAPRVPEIADIVSQLQAEERCTAALMAEQPDIGAFTERWHFTVSQQHRLRKVLWRWSLLAADTKLWDSELAGCRDGAGVLQCIEERVDALPIVLTSES